MTDETKDIAAAAPPPAADKPSALPQEEVDHLVQALLKARELFA